MFSLFFYGDEKNGTGFSYKNKNDRINMATSKEYIRFILEQLSGMEGTSYTKEKEGKEKS